MSKSSPSTKRTRTATAAQWWATTERYLVKVPTRYRLLFCSAMFTAFDVAASGDAKITPSQVAKRFLKSLRALLPRTKERSS